MKIIRLNDQEYETLLDLLNYEYNQELDYQAGNEERDFTLLERYLALYKKIYRSEFSKKNFFDNLVYNDLVNVISQEIDSLRNKEE